MNLHVLPTRTAGAAENMAVDFLLLQRYPDQNAPRFRHYDWRSPAFTFGYSQKIGYIRENLPAGERLEVVRRATGGGIVDHRNDWTYALVLPRGLAIYDARATQAYHDVHSCLARAFTAVGQKVELKARCDPGNACEGESSAALPTICFVRAELYDVLNPATGLKIAGAAMKRNKHGLLFQGSIEKSRVDPVDWDKFQDFFTRELGVMLGGHAQSTPWPDFQEGEAEALTEQYASSEWNESR